MPYTVIGSLKSRTLRVLWMLEELGLPYEFEQAGPRSDAVRKHNASGKIPVLLVDGEPLTDSTAILTFLADRHGALTAPAGTLARARQDALTQFVLDEMDAVLWTASRHSFVLPEERRVPAVKDSLKWEFETALARLSEKLGDKPFLTGDAFAVPDIVATHCCNWAVTARFPEPDARVAGYLERMRARPAYARAQERGAQDRPAA